MWNSLFLLASTRKLFVRKPNSTVPSFRPLRSVYTRKPLEFVPRLFQSGDGCIAADSQNASGLRERMPLNISQQKDIAIRLPKLESSQQKASEGARLFHVRDALPRPRAS